jgi:SAM-dependent methyltransferase/uncharacterized protein YbaR (Trm112 family)
MLLEDAFVGILRCPVCQGELDGAGELICRACGKVYAVPDGIPVLLRSAPEELGGHKAEQARFFGHITDPDWEIVRPAGSPAFYRGLLDRKFQYSVAGLRRHLAGATALTVCGGSGMDAEYLARAGARVITSDLSVEAVRRARERARRHGFQLVPLVADVEALPFADRSIDLVFVHDGLHHLERPLAGLAEMARVARVAVSVNEPARATVTRVAALFGLSETREDAGNLVERVEPRSIVGTLRASGFDIVCCRRFAMVYRHHPGPISLLLSIGPLRQAANGALWAVNATMGRVGNKLTVQAVRTHNSPSRPDFPVTSSQSTSSNL